MSDDPPAPVGTGYPRAQLTRAFVTALTAPDATVRQRAERRVARWRSVISGTASGRLRVGSRAPVDGLPDWVTLEVVRGGFATGHAVAAGPLTADEAAMAARLGVSDRGELFRAALGEPGLRELWSLLAQRTYRVTVAEEAALLTVAWLVRSGDTHAALELAGRVAPFADRLRFVAASRSAPTASTAGVAWRATAGQVRTTLKARRPHLRLETQREAVTVWAPFADEVLALWLETADGGRVGALFPQGWTQRAATMLARYEDLAARHTLGTKHRRPKENLAVLLAELRRAGAGAPADPRRSGLLRSAVDAMVHRRGVPGSAELRRYRGEQAAHVAGPTVQDMARVVAARLATTAQDRGLDDPGAVLRPARPGEAEGVPAGATVPASVARIVHRSTAGTPEQLIAAGVVPSAEVLAELVPFLTAEVVAAAFSGADDDGALATLVAETYRAFTDRRSLLLLDLQRQVRFDDLPWVAAVKPYATRDADVPLATLRRLAALALEAFPGTLLPNPLVAQLGVLARSGAADLPLVEELAADIFMGAFSPKFVRAAHGAGRLMRGTVYERYYGIDYTALMATAVPDRPSRPEDATGFAALCHRRAGVQPQTWSVAANGAVVEQAQILTTHNLAVLAGDAAVVPSCGWAPLADRSLSTVVALLGRLDRPRPHRLVKDAAYAWRQMVFQLALSTRQEQERWRTGATAALDAAPPRAAARLRLLLADLDAALSGGTPRRAFTGWTTAPHWLLGPSRLTGRDA